jgi:hypothetical protein
MIEESIVQNADQQNSTKMAYDTQAMATYNVTSAETAATASPNPNHHKKLKTGF